MSARIVNFLQRAVHNASICQIPNRFLSSNKHNQMDQLTSTRTDLNQNVISESKASKEETGLWQDTDRMQRLLMEQDQCILVNESDQVIGKASKKDCHLMTNIDKGMLHRAFSVILFNSKNECLLTQRASTKITFPDFYTNACCSHPLHNELELEQTAEDPSIGVKRAAQRRLAFELGIEPTEIPLTDFRYITRILYKAASNEGVWGEHEVDYILILRKDVKLKPNENEIRDHLYLNKSDFKQKIEQARKEDLVTPWFVGIYDKFLYQWWDNLDELDKLTDHNTIHRLE